MNHKLILIGGGGHCKSCIDVIELEDKFSIYGILDHESLVGQQLSGYEIIGTDDEIPRLVGEGYSFLITVGQIKSTSIRKRIYTMLKQLNAHLVVVYSPLAYVSKHAELRPGTIVMHHALVNADARVGENSILNTGSVIEHDVVIGKHCHISTKAVVNGNSKIGDEVFLGSHATVNNQVEIVDGVIVGAGAMVNRSIDQQGIWVGSPAKRIG